MKLTTFASQLPSGQLHAGGASSRFGGVVLNLAQECRPDGHRTAIQSGPSALEPLAHSLLRKARQTFQNGRDCNAFTGDKFLDESIGGVTPFPAFSGQ